MYINECIHMLSFYMYVCTHIHICVYVYVNIYIYVCIYTYIYVYTYTYIYKYTHLHICTYLGMISDFLIQNFVKDMNFTIKNMVKRSPVLDKTNMVTLGLYNTHIPIFV
jgi:TctA family transporter